MCVFWKRLLGLCLTFGRNPSRSIPDRASLSILTPEIVWPRPGATPLHPEPSCLQASTHGFRSESLTLSGTPGSPLLKHSSDKGLFSSASHSPWDDTFHTVFLSFFLLLLLFLLLNIGLLDIIFCLPSDGGLYESAGLKAMVSEAGE